MSWFALLGCVVITLASYGAHWGPFVGGATLFLLVLACGMTRSYKAAFGPTPAQGGLIAAVAVVIGISSPRGLIGSLELGGFFLIGAIWAIVLALYIWPIRSPALGRQTIVAIFSRLDEMLRSVEGLDASPGTDESQWDRFDTIYRRAARISIERGRSIVARISANRNLYSKGIDAAGRTFAAIIAIGHYRRESPGRFDQSWERPLVSGLRNVLQLVIQQADESALDAKVLMTEVTTLARNSKDGDGLVARAVSFAAHALQELVMQWEDPQPDQSPEFAGEIFPHMSLNTTVWRHSLRVSIAVLVCYCIGVWFKGGFFLLGINHDIGSHAAPHGQHVAPCIGTSGRQCDRRAHSGVVDLAVIWKCRDGVSYRPTIGGGDCGPTRKLRYLRDFPHTNVHAPLRLHPASGWSDMGACHQ